MSFAASAASRASRGRKSRRRPREQERLLRRGRQCRHERERQRHRGARGFLVALAPQRVRGVERGTRGKPVIARGARLVDGLRVRGNRLAIAARIRFQEAELVERRRPAPAAPARARRARARRAPGAGLVGLARSQEAPGLLRRCRRRGLRCRHVLDRAGPVVRASRQAQGKRRQNGAEANPGIRPIHQNLRCQARRKWMPWSCRALPPAGSLRSASPL